jgi:hypothetical protein
MSASSVSRSESFFFSGPEQQFQVTSRIGPVYHMYMAKPTEDDENLPPVLARLRDELKGSAVDPAAYRRYLERKYDR